MTPSDDHGPPAGMPSEGIQASRQLRPHWLVVGVVLGLVAGAAGMVLTWSLASGDSVGGAADDARAACAAMERAGQTGRDDVPGFNRRVAARGMAAAAEEQNGDYHAVADAIDAANRALNKLEPGSPQAREAVQKVKAACADL